MIKIITDSTCDIPAELIEKYGIDVVPCYLIWGNEQYRDRVDLQPEEFYRRIEANLSDRPTSSQPLASDFARSFQKAFEGGASAAVCLTISSAMSGTFQSATIAAQDAPLPVQVIDSHGPTMMLGWQVLAAARAAEKGADLAEVVQAAEQVFKSITLLVALESMSFLESGGRVGDAVRWLGKTLSIKPLVAVSRSSGKVVPVALMRTHKALVEGLLKHFLESMRGFSKVYVAVMHGDALAEAQQLAARLAAELNPAELIIQITGPVLGLNTGPQALAVCGYGED